MRRGRSLLGFRGAETRANCSGSVIFRALSIVPVSHIRNGYH